MQKSGDVGTVTEDGNGTVIVADLANPADQRTEAGGIHELHSTQVHDETGLFAELGERFTELGDRIGIELALGAELDVVGPLGTSDTDLKHGRMVTPVWARRHAPCRRLRTVGDMGPPCTLRSVPNILLATDSDALADEIEAAVAGTHLLHRVRAGIDVVPAIGEVDPALVLLDLQIGNMGGVAACLAVRQREEMGDLDERPVLLLLDRDVDLFLANEARADGHLVKPLDAFAVMRAVESAISQEPSSA